MHVRYWKMTSKSIVTSKEYNEGYANYGKTPKKILGGFLCDVLVNPYSVGSEEWFQWDKGNWDAFDDAQKVLENDKI